MARILGLGGELMWAQVINALVGLWLMAAPAALGFNGAARINHLIVGPIAATFAIIAVWEVVRTVGKLNVALGIWLVVAPLVLNHWSMVSTINSLVTGIINIALALTSGKTSDKFAGGWRSLVDSHTNY